MWVMLLASVAAAAAGPLLPVDRTTDLLAGLVVANLGQVGAALLCWFPRAHDRRERRAWRLVAVAILLTVAANVLTGLSAILPADVDLQGAVLWSDVLYLAYYPLADAAIVLVLGARAGRASVTAWLDGIVVATGVAGLAAAFLVAPLVHLSRGNTAGVVTDLAYPIADVSLLIVLFTIGGVTGMAIDRSLAWVAAGLALNLAADIGYLLLAVTDAGHADDPLNVLWLLAAAAIAAAARTDRATTAGSGAAKAAIRVPWRAFALPTAAQLAALAVLLAGFYDPLPAAAGVLAAACIVTALARTAWTIRELGALPAARREARTDALTGLANRRHLDEHCARLLAEPEAAPVAVLMIDLNGFKSVNDVHGHHAGDVLLIEVARRITGVLRVADLLARLGGDEFTAVLPATTAAQATTLARRIHLALSTPVVVNGIELTVQASIGVATFPPVASRGTDPTRILQAADIAMYEAKKARKATVTDRGH